MKQLMVIILMVFSVVCHAAADQNYQHGVMPVLNPPIIKEPESCAQFAKELDFNKPYMLLNSCQRDRDVGDPLSITYYILGKYGKQMEKDLIDKFNINPLKNDRLDDVWSSTTILEHYYSDDRVLVILVGMTDWGAKTRDDWDTPSMQFFIKFTQYPEPW